MRALVEPLVAHSSWTFRHPVEPAWAAGALRDWLAGIAAASASAGGHVLGHIKAYASLPAGGCIQGNATSTRQPPQVELHGPTGASLASLDVTLNVLVVGLEQGAACRQAIQALDAVAIRHGFTHSTSNPQSQGEHRWPT
jgi:hypothetical protein